MCCLDGLLSSLAQSERIAPRLTSTRAPLMKWGLFRPVLAAVNVLHRPASSARTPITHTKPILIVQSTVHPYIHSTASSSCGASQNFMNSSLHCIDSWHGEQAAATRSTEQGPFVLIAFLVSLQTGPRSLVIPPPLSLPSDFRDVAAKPVFLPRRLTSARTSEKRRIRGDN